MRLRWIPLMFLVTVVIELIVFIAVGNAIGFGLAFLLLFGLSLVGAVVLRREGIRAWVRFRTVTAAGERPGAQLTRSLVGLAGAVLLVIPGFVSAVVGALLFVPPVRGLAGRGVTRLAGRRLPSAAMGDLFGPRQVRVKVGKPTSSGPAAPASSGSTEVIEGEVIDPR